MPRRVPAKGAGNAQPGTAPPGYREHEWVAACTHLLDPEEVTTFRRRAVAESTGCKAWTGNAEVHALVQVLDVYCNRCGVRPEQDPWCRRHVSDDWFL